ncbi:MAG: hypothetical protein M5U15_04095 [Kiritimatiellae bacterium]|nr:hypothetical protein [Kiritimatiellia bacterium]
MSFNETTARHIQYDFDVKLLAKTGRTALFGALREGGLGLIMWSDIINVAQSLGAWQFVAIATDVDDPNGLHFEQWHIPRYAMAQALKQNEPTLQTAARSEAVQLHGMPLPTWLREDHSLAFHLDKFGEFVLPDSLVEQMKNDLPLLESAQAQVQPRDGKFYLPDWSTPRNHAVESPSRDLLTAIAFRKTDCPKNEGKELRNIFSILLISRFQL